MSLDTDKGGGQTLKDRTWRLEVEAPATGARSVRGHRETVLVDGDGVVSVDGMAQRQTGAVVSRELTEEVLAETDATSGLTVQELLDAVIRKLDEWRTADLA